MKSSLSGIPVSRAMVTDFHSLSLNDPLQNVVELILAGSQHDFPVVQDGQVEGILTRGDLIVALQKMGQKALTQEVMRRDFETAESTEMLEVISMRMQECNCTTIPDVRNGQLVGLITMENIGEFLMIQKALGQPALYRGEAATRA